MIVMWLPRVALSVCGCLLLLQGCGFHLRTTDLTSYVATAAVLSSKSPQIVSSMVQHLTELGIDVNAKGTPDVVIQIHKHNFQQKTSLLIPKGGLVEYELTLVVRIGVTFRNDQADPTSLTLSETQRVNVNADNLLSTSAEDEVVRGELVDKIVSATVRRLSNMAIQKHNEPK